MEFKKKTIIWEDNNEPPKDYIWVKSDGKAYEFTYITREWKEIMSSSGSGDCAPCEGESSTTEFSALTRNGKTVQESDLSEGDVVKPLYTANYNGPNKGDLVSAKMVNGKLEQTFVDNPDDYVVEEYEKCGETYSVLEKKVIPSKCIYYTTISGNTIDASTSTLGIESNVYQNGQGVITFSAPLTGAFTQTFLKQNNDLLTIELPDTITSIGERVFDKCKKLEKVKFPSGLQSIGAKAFNECNSLKEIKLPDSVNVINEGAFRRCYALKEVVIPENVTELNVENDYSGTFQDCTSLETVILPSGLKRISRDVFDNCQSLKSIYITKNVNYVHNNAHEFERPAFNACSGLREIVVDPRNTNYYSAVNCEEYNGIFSQNELIRGCATTTLPNNVTTIGFGAFSGCADFTQIDLSNITELDSWCFTMTGLESVHIPENLTSLNAWCFANCPKLEEITVDPNNSTYSSRNQNGDECNCIIGPAYGYNYNVLAVGCKNTTIPTDPELTTIGPGAFNNQSEMTSITIPRNITRIDGNNVFNGCSALEEVNYTGTIAEFEAINTPNGWHPWEEFMVPCTVVHCTDGDITKPNS